MIEEYEPQSSTQLIRTLDVCSSVESGISSSKGRKTCEPVEAGAFLRRFRGVCRSS